MLVSARGGRGDGTSQVANAQQFPYEEGLSLLVGPLNSNNQICLMITM